MAGLQRQIMELFTHFEPDIRQVVAAVLEVEQENIHMERPRLREAIGDILDRVAKESLKDTQHED